MKKVPSCYFPVLQKLCMFLRWEPLDYFSMGEMDAQKLNKELSEFLTDYKKFAKEIGRFQSFLDDYPLFNEEEMRPPKSA